MHHIPEFLVKRGITQIVGLDYETYYSTDYSLGKLSTTEYCRSKDFHVQGVGIQSATAQQPTWYTSKEDIADALNSIDWDKTALLAHNTPFDGFITSDFYKIQPAYYLDTRAMVRGVLPHYLSAALGKAAVFFGYGDKITGTLASLKGIKYPDEKQLKDLGVYCSQDVSLMWQLFDKIAPVYPELEFDLIDHTTRMYCEPEFVGDLTIALEELEYEKERRNSLFRDVARILSLPSSSEALTNLGSSKKFETILRNIGVAPPIKYSEKQEKWIPALAKNDLEFQELLQHPDENVRLLCEARLASKSNIAETRAERFIKHSTGGKLPIMLNMYGAHTHRWSGGDKFNPQNFPRNSRLKEALKAPRGYKILTIDSSQVECRVLAYLAGQEDILDAFTSTNTDPYCEMASSIYGRTITKNDNLERFVGKVAVLGLGFGMGAEKFRYTLAAGIMGPAIHISLDEANKIKFLYRHKNTNITKMWYRLEEILNNMHFGLEHPIQEFGVEFHNSYVVMPNGLSMHYPDLKGEFDEYRGRMGNFTYRSRGGFTKIYGGKFAENITQAFARTVVATQILEISKHFKPLLAVHDEGVFLVPNAAVTSGEAEKIASIAFKTSPSWAPGLPLDGEIKIADYYAK